MCNGIKSESKDKERELGFRAREQMEADFCCPQVGLCHRTVRFTLSVTNRWHFSTKPQKHCQHME